MKNLLQKRKRWKKAHTHNKNCKNKKFAFPARMCCFAFAKPDSLREKIFFKCKHNEFCKTFTRFISYVNAKWYVKYATRKIRLKIISAEASQLCVKWNTMIFYNCWKNPWIFQRSEINPPPPSQLSDLYLYNNASKASSFHTAAI